jgi:RecG-like helicase
MNQNKKPYARGSKKNTKKANNNISLHGLSFGNSFSMKRFNPKKAAQSYAPSAASSAFVPQNQQQAFQLQMNEAVAKQNAAYQQKQDIITQHRSNAAIRGWAKRRDKAAAALAAASAAVERAEMDIEGQGRMSRAASNIEIAHAQQALAAAQEAQRTALDEYTALQQALADLGSTSTSSSSAANYANENNGSARANNGSASASAASSESPANFFGKFKP